MSELVTMTNPTPAQVSRIAAAFGDPDTRHVSIASLRPGSAGGTVVTWYNTSLVTSPPEEDEPRHQWCPSDVIQGLHDVMYTPEESIRATFADR